MKTMDPTIQPDTMPVDGSPTTSTDDLSRPLTWLDDAWWKLPTSQLRRRTMTPLQRRQWVEHLIETFVLNMKRMYEYPEEVVAFHVMLSCSRRVRTSRARRCLT